MTAAPARYRDRGPGDAGCVVPPISSGRNGRFGKQVRVGFRRFHVFRPPPLARNLSQSVARVFTAYDPGYTDGRYLPYLSRVQTRDNTVARPPPPLSPRGLCTDIFARARLRDARTLQ